jgi:hypothetical protein
MAAQQNIAPGLAGRNVQIVEAQKLSFELAGTAHPRRQQVEATIVQRFADVYGAAIEHFMPQQLCVRLNDDIVATVGIRQAYRSALFLEQYFDKPVEWFASRTIGREIGRDEIVEIGNLASTWRGASQWLFVVLTLLLCEQQQPWVTFTATPEVQKLLRRLDITPQVLASAEPDRLGDSKASWGNYYAQKPQVMITHAPTAKWNLLTHPVMSTLAQQLATFVPHLKTQWLENCGMAHDNTH